MALVQQGGSYMLVLFVLYFETGSGDLVRARQGLKLPTKFRLAPNSQPPPAHVLSAGDTGTSHHSSYAVSGPGVSLHTTS